MLGCAKNLPIQGGNTEKVVSLSPHITEIIYALKQQQKLVAVTDFCTYPAEAQNKTKIGGLINPNLEQIISLKAGLFIGTPAHSELAKKLARQNINCVLLPNDNLQDIFTSIDSIGKLLDCRATADSLNRALSDSILFYTNKAKKLDKHPRTMLAIGRESGSVRKITVSGGSTFISSLWNGAGGENVFSDLPAKYALINREALLAEDPDVIIEFKFKEAWDSNKQRQNLSEWSELANLKAVKNAQIYVLTGDYTLIPSPRIYLLLKDYYQILYKLKQGTTEI